MTKEEFIKYLDSFNKDSGEFTEDELYEIGCKFKNELPLSEKDWSWLVEKLGPVNAKGEPKSGETFRIWIKSRQYQKGEIKKNEQLLSGQTINDLTFEEFEDKTEEIKQSLYKQQVKTRDSLNAYRRVLREEARLEDFKELLKSAVTDITKLPEVHYSGEDRENGAEGVLMLSDIHIGVAIKNYFNNYNVDICRARLDKVLQDTIRYCQAENVKRLYVLLLGDTCQGLIHTSARLEQQIFVTQQIMTISEILADFFNKLQVAAPEIIICTCTDNHCRMMPDLHESVEAENYGLLIPFYLKPRLANTNIKFKEDNLDQELGLIEFENGKVGVFMHGHHDNVNTIFQNMVAYTHRVIDYGFIGHYHCEKMKTFNIFKLFINSSLVGMDQYAFSRRLFSKPAQSLIIFDGDNIINHSINLEYIQ